MIAGTATVTDSAVRSGLARRRHRQRGAGTLVFAAVALLFTLFGPLATPAAAEWSAPRTVYIDQTGQSLDQVFLDVWRDNGGANSYGYPITPEITLDNGHVVQYFGYARFEYWPEGDADGKHFHFGNIGEELRPISLQRSIATWSSTTSSSTSARSEETLAIAKAWLPVAAEDIAADARLVDETSHTVSGEFRQFWENTGEAGYLGNPLTEQYTENDTTYQVFERGQLAYNATDGTSLVPVGQVLADRYKLSQAPVAQGDLPSYSEDLFIPPPEPAPSGVGGGYIPGGGEVWVDINLSSQYMLIYQGDTVIGETYVSTGRAGFDTPTGTYHVNTKYVSDDMEGVLGGEYYNVPAVPDVMYFTDVGHAIHGAYWHNNFGTPMSHGCVNMPLGMAEWLYSIAPIGMTVVIHY
jgi:hypothetical protein